MTPEAPVATRIEFLRSEINGGVERVRQSLTQSGKKYEVLMIAPEAEGTETRRYPGVLAVDDLGLCLKFEDRHDPRVIPGEEAHATALVTDKDYSVNFEPRSDERGGSQRFNFFKRNESYKAEYLKTNEEELLRKLLEAVEKAKERLQIAS